VATGAILRLGTWHLHDLFDIAIDGLMAGETGGTCACGNVFRTQFGMWIMAIKAAWRTWTLPAWALTEPVAMMIDFKGGMLRWRVEVNMHDVLAKRFSRSIREVTVIVWPHEGAKTTGWLHVALQAHVVGQRRREVFRIED